MAKVTVIKATSSNLEEVFEGIMKEMLHGLAHSVYLEVKDDIDDLIKNEQEAGADIESICHSVFELGYQIAVKQSIDSSDGVEE